MMVALKKYRYLIILFILFLVSEFLVRPTGGFPLNDDWSYTKSVMIFVNENKIDIGEWPAMTLLTHIIWGALFVKSFGFSFFILRLSTLLLSFVAVGLIYFIILRRTRSEVAAVTASLSLMFYPLFFSLSNTFMTDVNFTSLLVISAYCVMKYTEKPGIVPALLFLASSLCLVLLRQFGIVVPACFILACLFMEHRKLVHVAVAVIILAVVYGALLYYEDFLKRALPAESAYKFSGELNLTDPDFYDLIYANFLSRWKLIVVHLSLFTFPVGSLLVSFYFREKKLMVICTAGVGLIISLTVFKDVQALQGNIFSNMSLGAETFYESLINLSPPASHTYSQKFENVLIIFKHITVSIAVTAFVILVQSIVPLKKHQWKDLSPLSVFSGGIIVTYGGALFVTQSFFDRYHLPLIAFFIMALATPLYSKTLSRRMLLVPAVYILLMAYVSVAGTRDYFTLNATKWKAYQHLKTMGVPLTKINAGFEINCWNDGNPGWWSNVLTTDLYDYIIQYRTPEKFTQFRKYSFRRYFPICNDTLVIAQKKIAKYP
jgi:4-amino-4-deoxy-L-arabinose transferase-like glycosyltransferase